MPSAIAQPTATVPAGVLGPAPVTGTTYTHDPFDREQCGTCHDLQNPQHPEALWASSVVETCRLCHWQEIDAPQPSNIHRPFPEGKCLTCHDPHASDQPYLLKAPQKQLCRECHAAPRQQSHPSIAQEECLLCHDAGHGSDQPVLLREPQAKLCARCHADHTQENAAFTPHAEMATECTLCHDPHTGQMAKEITTQGCQQCHADVFAAKPAVSHSPVVAGLCLVCHDFHQKAQFALLAKPLPDLCRDCHPVGQPVKQVHPDTAQGECLLCHAGHGSEHQALLRRTQSDLCATCHQVSTHGNTDFAFRFENPFQVNCTACHNPHGPVGNLALIRDVIQGNAIAFTARSGADSFDEPDDDNQDDLCATCHSKTDHNRVPSNQTESKHFEGAECTRCHAHNRDDRSETVDGFMLGEAGCSICHGQPPPPANDGYPLDEKTLPHLVHAGDAGYGFDCLRCHNTDAPNYAGHNTAPATFQDVWFDDFNPKGRYDSDTLTCGNVYCHSNGATARTIPGEPVYASPVWTDPESGACGTCHGITEETLTTGIHPKHLTFAACDTCHAEYGQPAHVNQQIDFADGKTLTDTEVCSRCHGDRASEFKQTLLEAQDKP